MPVFTRLIFSLAACLLPAVVSAQLAANFTATPIVGCAPLVVQFSDLSTGSPTAWSWNLGNSTTSVLQNPSTTYTAPGTYTVTLTVTNAGGTHTYTQTAYITVYNAPQVAFTANNTVSCPPLQVQFTDNSNPSVPGPATYNWNFGDGSSSTLQNPTYTYNVPGYYNVTLIVTNNGGCVSTLTKPGYMHVYTPPVADFSAPVTSFCYPPGTVNFTANITGSGPYIYQWNFGDGNAGTGASPTHVYNSPGAYTVSLTVTDINGCKDTIVKTSYIGVGTIQAGFNAPAAACEGTPVSFVNTSAAALSYLWDFGDAAQSTAISPAHIYTAPGVYTVRLIAFSGSCSDTVSLPIIIHPKPDADFTSTPVQPCPAPSTIQFNNQTTNGSSYNWYFGDGGISTATNPTHTYLNNTVYSVMLVATNSLGCKDTMARQDHIKIYDLDLEAGALPYQGCVPLTVDFSSSRFTNIPVPGANYPYGVSTWHWDFGDGNTSADSTPTHIYTAPGSYTIILNVTTLNGCTDTDTIQVLVGTLPTAAFTFTPDTICVNGQVTFTNLSSGATSYIWTFGDGGSTGATHPVYTYGTSGTYTVNLYAYNNGCPDMVAATRTITVLPPTSLFEPLYDCDSPLLVRFNDFATIGATSRIWDFGDGSSAVAVSPVHTYSAPGSYNVSLITFNNSSGCSDTETVAIQLIDPVPSFITNDTTLCRGDSIVFHASYTGTAVQYDWYIGNTVYIDSPSSIGYRFTQNGIYTVKIVIQDLHDCRDTAIREHYILTATPEPAFSGVPSPGCVPLNVTFTDQTVHVLGTYTASIHWDFGDGNASTGSSTSISHNYTAAGIYDVTMILTNNIGCFDTLQLDDYIEARQPVASFHANDTTACIDQVIHFTNTSSGGYLSAQWDFGDGSSSVAQNPSHVYTATGHYTVRLIVTDASGCKDTLIKNNYISLSKPVAGFTVSDTLAICPPLNALFTNTSSGGAAYYWDFGNGNTSTFQTPSSIYPDPGIYNISLIVTDVHGCKDTAYGYTHILGYAGALSYTPLAGCKPLEVHFSANLTNVPSLVWDFSDGTTAPVSGSNTTVHTYTTPGAYVPKLILSDGTGCMNSSEGIDTIKVDGVSAAFKTTPGCIHTPIVFEDMSSGFFSDVIAWNWDINNGEAGGTQSALTWMKNTPGIYPVKLIATNANGCSDTLFSSIQIYGLPGIHAGEDTLICPGDAAFLTADGGVSYAWNDGGSNTLSCLACPAPLATPLVPTSYTVTGTDGNGCQNKDTVAVGMQYLTTSTAGPGGEICIDSSFSLSITGAERYEWQPAASLDQPFSDNPVASPHITTTYTVKAWEGSCPPNSHEVTVVVHPKPQVNAGNDETIIAGNSVMLQGTGTLIQHYLWSPEATLSCTTCSNPVAAPVVTTSYILTAVSTFGCRSTDTVTVFVLCDNSQVFIPNTFSPNGDGQNEIFFPRGHGLKEIASLRIYNRWGELIFEKKHILLNDEANGWDGRYKGQELSPDVFVYIIEGICESGDPIHWKGDLTLLR